MERPMTQWNDDRLDELNERMKEGFKAMREEMGELRTELRTELRSLNERFDRLYYTLLVTWIAGVASFFVN